MREQFANTTGGLRSPYVRYEAQPYSLCFPASTAVIANGNASAMSALFGP